MSNNPYKDFYDAANSGDEYAGVRMAEARKRIERLKEEASWNGTPERSLDEEYNFSGGD